jgi:phage tail sheath protein FI
MANFVSPGVYTVEKDISDYPVAGNSSIVGIVGFASKGPVNKATLITSQEGLIKTFGEPNESIPGQGLEGALEILETTRSIYYVRAADSDAISASAVVQIGTVPTILVSANSYGVSSDLYLKVQVADNNGVEQYIVPKEFSIPSGLVASSTARGQYLALNQIIGGSVDSDKIGVFTKGSTVYLAGSYAGSASYISVSSYSDSTFLTATSALRAGFVSGTSLLGTQSYGSSMKVFGGAIPKTSAGYLVQSLYPGAGYVGGLKTDGTVSGNSVEIDALGNSNVVLTINDKGSAAEQFKVSLTSTVFVENIINIGLENAKSEYIKGYLVSGPTYTDISVTSLAGFDSALTALGLPAATEITYGGFIKDGAAVSGSGNTTLNSEIASFGKFMEANSNLAGGTNGTGTDSENYAAIVGSPGITPKTGIYALDYDDLNISIGIVPGFNNPTVQNPLITLAESSQNFLALVAPPYGAINTPQEAIEWTNGRSETRTVAINSNYAAVYWPWVKVFSVFDGIDRWYDPSIFAARQMCFTDSVADTWFAPAGFRRGRLTKPIEVEVNLNQGDRDSLYSGGNIINPIVNFPQAGITIFGQRTAQRTPSALDRVNVRRLMIYLRKAVLNSTQSFVFEPNDPFTWEAVRNVISPLLEDIRSRRGIINYSVVCDETTNTPVRVDRNELWCKVIIQPTKAAEIIVFELNVTNQSAKLGG